MRKYFPALFLVVSSFILFSCETNPPNGVEKEYGELAVFSNLDEQIDTIKIFVDGEFTGKYSPAVFTLETGAHEVYLKYDTVRTNTMIAEVTTTATAELYFKFASENGKKVLLEDFANVSCDPCVTSSEILNNLLNGRYSNGELVVLRFATNFPSPNDPFYTANPDLFDSRISFYNVLFAPTTIVDGDDKPISTDSVSIIASVEDALSAPTDFTLTVNAGLSNDSISVGVAVDYPAGTDIENLVLFTVLAKNRVEYSEPPGSNGETVFNDVAVQMLPDNNGIALTDLSDGAFEKTVFNAYGLERGNFKVVAFVQNTTTKEILQTNTN